MKWNKFRLKTTTEAEDIVSSMLMDLGIQGVEIEDKIPLTQSDKEKMFVDILPQTEADDGVAYLSFYLEPEEDKEKILSDVRKELEEMSAYVNVGECLIEESETEDVDWVNNWKQYFHQFYVDDVLIIPSWEEVKPEDEDKMIIHIDPGTAFGTGMHETTQLCIRQIRKYVTENTKILDVGCGSGILGMLALKFGAKYSVGTDLDPCAIDATHENMEVNGISKDRYEVMIGNIIDDKEVQDKVGYECYDIVAANILADVLVALTPVVVNQIKKGGIYITSGIIDDKEETVVEAVKKAGLEVLDITYQGEWVCVTARKRNDFVSAQFYRLLYDPFHLIAFRKSLKQNNFRWKFRLGIQLSEHIEHCLIFLIPIQAAKISRPLTVIDPYIFSHFHAKYIFHMVEIRAPDQNFTFCDP